VIFPLPVVRGALKFNVECCGLGFLTFEDRPPSRMRLCASIHDGTSASGCVQWATDASSHQFKRCGIAALCDPDNMNCRILSSLSQSVIVQKVHLLSGRSAPVWNPRARFICLSDRHV
jgi:hypothetical protein